MRCHDRRRQQLASLYQTSRPCFIIQFVETVISARENHKEPTLYTGSYSTNRIARGIQAVYPHSNRPSTSGTQVPTNTPTAAPLASWGESPAHRPAKATVRVEFAMDFPALHPSANLGAALVSMGLGHTYPPPLFVLLLLRLQHSPSSLQVHSHPQGKNVCRKVVQNLPQHQILAVNFRLPDAHSAGSFLYMAQPSLDSFPTMSRLKRTI